MTRRPWPVTRTVGYSWQHGDPLPEHEAAEREILRAVEAGTVLQWDADPGWRCVWLTGRPGADLRRLVDGLRARWGPSLARLVE